MRVRELLIFHEIKGYLQCRRQILMFIAFCSLSMLELQCTESLVRALGTLIAGL